MGKDEASVRTSGARRTRRRTSFFADAGPFVSNADRNCTWTIMALSSRTSRSGEELKKGTLGNHNARREAARHERADGC